MPTDVPILSDGGSRSDAASTSEAPTMLELVDESGATIGTAEKMSAHVPPGLLHRAFSVFLFDGDGAMLLQQRALTKYHSPGIWSNSCCGHPFPAESPPAAATRRVREELGVTGTLLHPAGTVRYTHPDPASGLVEQEFNHLFVGHVREPLRPDPDEIAAVRFVPAAEVDRIRAGGGFSAWFGTVLDAARPAIRDLVPDAGW